MRCPRALTIKKRNNDQFGLSHVPFHRPKIPEMRSARPRGLGSNSEQAPVGHSPRAKIDMFWTGIRNAGIEGVTKSRKFHPDPTLVPPATVQTQTLTLRAAETPYPSMAAQRCCNTPANEERARFGLHGTSNVDPDSNGEI